MAKSKDGGEPMFIFKSATLRSGNTVERYRTPTNPHTAKFMTQYVADYSNQKAFIPDNNRKALMEATQGVSNGMRSTNTSGRTAALGPLSRAFLGASPDDPANF